MKLALTAPFERETVQLKVHRSEEHHSFFSRAVHFALALLPMALGVAWTLYSDFARTGQAKPALISYALFLVGVGFALVMLRALDQLADSDRALGR